MRVKVCFADLQILQKRKVYFAFLQKLKKHKVYFAIRYEKRTHQVASFFAFDNFFGLFCLERSHMVAEGVEFHFHSGEVHLMEGSYEATEGSFCAILYLFVGQETMDS